MHLFKNTKNCDDYSISFGDCLVLMTGFMICKQLCILAFGYRLMAYLVDLF